MKQQQYYAKSQRNGVFSSGFAFGLDLFLLLEVPSRLMFAIRLKRVELAELTFWLMLELGLPCLPCERPKTRDTSALTFDWFGWDICSVNTRTSSRRWLLRFLTFFWAGFYSCPEGKGTRGLQGPIQRCPTSPTILMTRGNSFVLRRSYWTRNQTLHFHRIVIKHLGFQLGNHCLYIGTGSHTFPRAPEHLRICSLCQYNATSRSLLLHTVQYPSLKSLWWNSSQVQFPPKPWNHFKNIVPF